MQNASFFVRAGLVACVFLVAAAGIGCGSTMSMGEPTGNTCPQGSTLTYDNFGKAFMQQFCTRCHASTVAGVDRHGAPSDHNFDTLAGVAGMIMHIDAMAAAGPMSINTVMPPDAPTPTEQQRRQLGEWLACGAP